MSLILACSGRPRGPESEAEAASQPASWTAYISYHAVAVRGQWPAAYVLLCNGLGKKGEQVSKVLWLDPQGKPREFGYMKDILRVYRVAPYAT